MSDLSDEELDQLLQDAIRADAAMSVKRVHWDSIANRIRRLLQEQRRLREQAGESERMGGEEQAW